MKYKEPVDTMSDDNSNGGLDGKNRTFIYTSWLFASICSVSRCNREERRAAGQVYVVLATKQDGW